MRQAIEQKRAQDREQAVQAAQRGGANHQARNQQQDPSQQDQGPVPDSQPMDDQQPPADDQQLSGNAQKRIRELSQTLRQKDQELQQAMTQLRAGQETQSQTKARLEALEAQYQHIIQQNLDSLDPETRAAVMTDAKIREGMAGIEQRLRSEIQSSLKPVREQSAQRDLHDVAIKYPGFDYEIHIPLIEAFRERNPHCSVEQAFRAVAEPEELLGRRQVRAAEIPPTVAPGTAQSLRYAPQAPKTTPEEELQADRDRAFQLARSGKPEDRRAVGKAFDKLIASRINVPGQRRQ